MSMTNTRPTTCAHLGLATYPGWGTCPDCGEWEDARRIKLSIDFETIFGDEIEDLVVETEDRADTIGYDRGFDDGCERGHDEMAEAVRRAVEAVADNLAHVRRLMENDEAIAPPKEWIETLSDSIETLRDARWEDSL